MYLQIGVKQILELFSVLVDDVWKFPQPAFHKRLESQYAGLQVDHTTPGYGGWGGHGQILYLKHHCHSLQNINTTLYTVKYTVEPRYLKIIPEKKSNLEFRPLIDHL